MFVCFSICIFAVTIVLFGKRDKASSRLYFDVTANTATDDSRVAATQQAPMTVSVGGTVLNEKPDQRQRRPLTTAETETVDGFGANNTQFHSQNNTPNFNFAENGVEAPSIFMQPEVQAPSASSSMQQPSDPLAAFKEAANKYDPNTMKTEAQDLFAQFSKKGSL